jgi:hypothetical protein
MARSKDNLKKDNLKIAVTPATDGDERITTVTIVARAADFTLPDLLSDQGAIDSYAERLIKAVKEATDSYLQEAKDVVAAIAEQKQGRQAPEPDRPPKQKDVGKEAGQKRAVVAAAETAPAPISRPGPERVNGPTTV